MKFPSSRTWQAVVLLLVITGVLFLSLSGYLTPIFGAATNPLIRIQAWIATRYIAIYDFITAPREMQDLRVRNLELEREVASLQNQVINLQEQLREAEVLYALLDFARTNPENRYVAASVIGKDPNPFLRYIIIDHGSDDGIYRGMPVVTDKGLIGRIDAVTARAARVQLLSDPGFNVNVRIKPSNGDAIVKGSITGDILLEMAPQDISLNPGDLMLTSGLGGEFPPNVIIGQVDALRSGENDLFQSASVQPAVDYSSLQAVLVIVNFRPVDISPLIPGE